MSIEKKVSIMIIGHKQHGKTSLADALAAKGYTMVDSSIYAAEQFMFDQLKDKYGYATWQECHEDRGNHRPEWYVGIREYNNPDPTRMVKEILALGHGYAGLRHPEEFAAAKHLFDHIIWVDACNRKPKEGADSMGLKPTDATYHLCNNGTKAQFAENIELMMQRLKLPTLVKEPAVEWVKPVKKRGPKPKKIIGSGY